MSKYEIITIDGDVYALINFKDVKIGDVILYISERNVSAPACYDEHGRLFVNWVNIVNVTVQDITKSGEDDMLMLKFSMNQETNKTRLVHDYEEVFVLS